MIDSSWRDFFVDAGGAAATFIGLVFVAVSLHARDILSSDHTSALARGTFFHLLSIVFVGLLALVPGLADGVLAGLLLALSAIGCARVVRSLVAFQRATLDSRADVRGIPFRAFLTVPLIGWSLYGAAGLALGAGRNDIAIRLIAPAVFILFIAASVNSWSLLTVFARERRHMPDTSG